MTPDERDRLIRLGARWTQDNSDYLCEHGLHPSRISCWDKDYRKGIVCLGPANWRLLRQMQSDAPVFAMFFYCDEHIGNALQENLAAKIASL